MNLKLADKPPASSDIAATMAIMTRAFPPEYGEGWTEDQLCSTLRMANVDLFLIGSAEEMEGFALTRTAIDETELLLIAVVPQQRRKSLGHHLLRHIEEHLQENGVKHFFLEMRAGNPAENLYRLHRFKQIGRRANYYTGIDGARYDALTFGKELTPASQ